MNIVALIGAKSTSKRIPNKNIREFGYHKNKHPLMAYTIRAAIDSGIFDRVIVSTDSSEYREIAKKYGAEGWKRHKDTVDPLATDFEWIFPIIDWFKKEDTLPDCFAILRPTSPFRSAVTIRRAWDEFKKSYGCSSLRAIAKCKQTPYKMFEIGQDNILKPILNDIPFAFNEQYQGLPRIYCQTGSIEIAWSGVTHETKTVSGSTIKAFYIDEIEGFDINDELDWILAEELLFRGMASLPKI